MEADLGFAHIWTQGDWVIRLTVVLLLLMSVATWSVIALKALRIRELHRHARQVERFWRSPDFSQGLQQLGGAGHNPYHQLALHASLAKQHLTLSKGAHAQQLHDQLDLSDWVSRALRNSLDDSHARLQSGMSILASVGSTAPYVGLFGTVWKIYYALVGIGVGAGTSIDQVAGPIGAALIMTALGLLVAIPAVLGYNALVRSHKAHTHRLNRFGHDLHAYLVTGARVAHSLADPAASSAGPGRGLHAA